MRKSKWWWIVVVGSLAFGLYCLYRDYEQDVRRIHKRADNKIGKIVKALKD